MNFPRSVHIFPHKSSSDFEFNNNANRNRKEKLEEHGMDRYFKLRQMFSDYLDLKTGESTKTPPTPVYYPPISTMTDDVKKRLSIKKITEEEAEAFDVPPEHFRPVLIQEPAFELRWYNKPDALGGRFQTDADAETASKLAQKLLTVFLKTEMLESATFKYDDIRAIRVFFMDDREMANDRLLSIFDNILSVSMNKMGQFSDKISVTIDYELRAFMADQKRAKRLVLEAMLKYPEYVPDSWGGESAILKWKEMKEADIRRREADAKEMVEMEKKDREEKCKKEEEKVKNEEEKAKKEKERQEKEERIKKEVEEAERKKKEEKENRRREVKKNREERAANADRTRKDKKDLEMKTAFEKGVKDVLNVGKKNKNKEERKKKKMLNKKTNETTKTKDASHEEGIHSPKTPPQPPVLTPPHPQSPQPPPSAQPPHHLAPGQHSRHPHQTPPRKTFSVAGVSQFLSGRKRRESSAEKLGGAPVEHKKNKRNQKK
ncbi:unnamed protein product [Caenorhabditis brenneri]